MSTPTAVQENHIVATPEVCGGKPRIVGHRITVENIVTWHERLGWSADEIAAEYGLTLAEVYGALSYYFDHRAEIDASMRAGEALAEALRAATPSLVQQKRHAR